jgi:hypothetical protein
MGRTTEVALAEVFAFQTAFVFAAVRTSTESVSVRHRIHWITFKTGRSPGFSAVLATITVWNILTGSAVGHVSKDEGRHPDGNTDCHHQLTRIVNFDLNRHDD